MTASQLLSALCVYAAAFVAIVLVTRANPRRALGALIGAAIVGAFFLIVFRAGLRFGWWRTALPSGAGFSLLLYAATSISLAPIYPVTWRLARRFGRRGLAASLAFAGLVGPPRDYLVANLYPEWVTFSPGIGPVLVVSATYVVVVGLGHAIMRMVSGPAERDPLVQRARGAA